MTLDSWTLSVILAMTVAAALCRFVGFWFMQLIPMTDRVRAGLAAIPLAVMLGIIVPPAMRGGIPELVGIVAAMGAVRFGGNDVVAILAGMGTVAGLRALGL